MTAGAIYLYYLNYKRILREEIEMRSAKMAIYPMLLAERDREFLKQLRRNRTAEADLMRDVPGWKVISSVLAKPTQLLKYCVSGCWYIHIKINISQVGTYYGERVYKLVPEDKLVEPIFHEFYAHSSPKAWYDRTYIKFRS